MEATATGVRAQAKQAMLEAILTAARRQLAEVGPAALSVRAVARDVGMASSAIYRHVASRDELLTALITDAYEDLGAAIEDAELTAARGDHAGRFRDAANGARQWALSEPHRYALVYGSPVPGYIAPEATIGPATRGTAVFARILVDATAAGTLSYVSRSALDDRMLAPQVVDDFLPGVSVELATEGVLCWAEIFGLISFELFGHLVGSVADNEAFFEAGVNEMVSRLGLG